MLEAKNFAKESEQYQFFQRLWEFGKYASTCDHGKLYLEISGHIIELLKVNDFKELKSSLNGFYKVMSTYWNISTLGNNEDWEALSQEQLDIFAAYKKPVQASFNVANLSDAVCGRLRAGDYVDIFGVDINQGKRIIENAYIFKAYDNAGVQISVSDTTAIATNFTIILESDEEKALYEMLKNSTLIVTKKEL